LRPQMRACTLPPVVTTADFDQLSESEKGHFYKCTHAEKWLIGGNSTRCCFMKPITSHALTFNTAAQSESKNERAVQTPF
jgi:hypothetical protein